MADIAFECVCLVLFVLCATNLDFTRALDKSEQHPARDFSRHTLIKPRIYHGREKRQITTTRQENGEHTHHIVVIFDVGGRQYTIDLNLNTNLIPKGYFTRYQKNGTHIVNKPTAQEIEFCHYKGKVRGISDSWAALSTCDGIKGVVFDGKEMHYIEKGNIVASDLEDLHFLYRHSDLVEHNKTCGYGGDAYEHDHLNNNRILRYKRTAETEGHIRGPYNANKQSRYVELVLVVDNREFKELGDNTSRVEQHCKNIANIINGLYAPLNIFVALVGVVIWTEYDEVDFSSNGDTTLTNFLHYRREKLIKEHPNDNAQLLTKYNFDKGVVGKALKGPICTYEYSGGVNTDHSPVLGLVATTVAHEMGHNFGMEHDTNECKCPEDRCIMAPSSSTVPPTHWSSCSLEYLALAFEHGMDYCLRNKPVSLFDSPVCGNGFVELGEQCDCGLPEHCDNTCCNATTCMLYSNASCATGECCDLNTCRPKRAGTLCRSADYECDLPEYCTGQSEYCPSDIYKMDTEVCDGGKAYCYHGFCRTRTDQCKLLWGTTGKSSDEQCYKMNTKGTRHGNCGYNKLTQSYFKCHEENVLCGMLHCKHLNERLEFGMESVAILSHSFINLKGSIIPCRTAIVDLGINQIDPGLAPDGAKCGDEKMCVNQKCMEVASLRKAAATCPYDCNGNGVCNSLGHCHCRDGFAPPFCDYPGPGGSEDSGPASDPNARRDFITALFVIFLGIIPVMALVAFLMYYAKHNFKPTWKKSPAASKSPTKSRGPPSFPPETTKRTEDNHSLLHEDSATTPIGLQNEFFGRFKGFTLTPAKTNEPEPIRSAPPVPVVPPVLATPPSVALKSPNLNRSNTTALAKASFLNQPVRRAPSCAPTNISKAISVTNNTSVAPALPPPNPGSHSRPIISSPILENSTCTAKELLSPLRNAPKVPLRPAPKAPEKENKRPLSSPDAVINTVTFADDVKKPKENNTALNRIASFLKSNDKKPMSKTNSLPRTHNSTVKANKVLNKNALRTMEISNPILQNDIDIGVKALPVDNEETKAVVMRAQSMRGPKVTTRPAIPTFGSMRQVSGNKRPVSIPSGNRPKSPPPPRPSVAEAPKIDKPVVKIPGLPGYQKPSVPPSSAAQNQYDDCLNKAPLANLSEENSPTSDNIYAVIEETPSSPESKAISNVKSNSGSNESMGLLGEIVSEIQNRNFDSIYSTSTLARKKKEEEEKLKSAKKESPLSPDLSETYVNTSGLYKSPDSVYSNMNNMKSSASSTSSGYINPSSVNPPIKQENVNLTKPLNLNRTEPPNINKTEPPKVLSTFKTESNTYKPYTNSRGPLASTYKNNTPKPEAKVTTPPSPTSKTAKPLSRQSTPPNLRSRKPSPTRSVTPTKNAVAKIKPTSNSPDLVTSCSTKASNKSPDVLNSSNVASKKPTVTAAKPNLAKTALGSAKVNKSVSLKTTKTDNNSKPAATNKVIKMNSDVTPKVMPAGARSAARQSSNVASLQQKFENKPPVGIKAQPVKNKA